MLYRVDYQYVPQGKRSPDLSKTIEGDEFESDRGMELIPNVGDAVRLERSDSLSFVQGVVRSRLFSYLKSKSRHLCVVTIVVKEADMNRAVYGDY
jgi:hypothetical protein